MTQNSPQANSIPEEWLSAYIDDELSTEQRQLVEVAVKEQPKLAQLLDELIATRRLIQQLPAFPTSSSRRSPSSSKTAVSDLDDGLDSLDDSSNSNNLASASDRQLQQRLADDRPTVDLARSDESDSSSGLSWRMLTLAASLIGVAALGATLWYQSDRWFNLAFDTSSDNRVGSAMIPEGLVDSDSGPKAFAGGEGSVAPMSAPMVDPLSMQRSMPEGGMGGASGSGSGGREIAGGFGEGGFGVGGLGGGGLGTGGLGGGLAGSTGEAPTGVVPDKALEIAQQSSGQTSAMEAFNLLHEDAKVFNAPAMQGAEPPKRSDGFDPSDLLAGSPMPGSSNQFGAPNALEYLTPSSSSAAGAMSTRAIPVEPTLDPQRPSAAPPVATPTITTPSVANPSVANPSVVSPSLNSPAPSDIAMELRGIAKPADASQVDPNINRAMPMNAAPAAPSIAAPSTQLDASELTDPAKPAPASDLSPKASPEEMLERLRNAERTVEPLPPPAPANSRAMPGMKAKQGSKEASDSDAARPSEPMRGLDAANSGTPAPSLTPPAAPLSEAAQSTDAVKGEALKKNLPLKAQDKNQVLISKSALYRSSAWSEAAVTAQMEGNPLYRPMLSLLSDTKQDKSTKQQAAANANQADDSVLTAVVRLTANQRAAVIEQSKQLGIEPAIKDDGQTAWVLFLSATELDRLLDSANQQEKLSIFWISPAKQSASGDRRVLIVNPF